MSLLDRAYAAVATLARERGAFTTDDAWALLGTNADDDVDARTIANAFMRAERRGLIQNSYLGAYLRGRQAHRRWLTIWLSALRPGTPVDAADYARQSTPIAADAAAR